MNKKILIITSVLCLIGAIIALFATTQYFRIQKEGLEEKSFCTISENIDCDIVTASSYSTLADIPVAWFGFLCYILIGAFSSVGAFIKNGKASVAIAWFLSLFSVLYSIRMAYILFNVLDVFCVECVVMYTIDITIAILLWIALGILPFKLKDFFVNYIKAMLHRPTNLDFSPRPVLHIIIIAAVMLLGWLGMYSKVMASEQRKIPIKEKIAAHYMQSLYDIPIDPSWPVWGNPDAPVTIIEFSDFQCPFCKLAAFNIRPYLREFRKNVRLFFVNYPLDNNCNPNVQFPMHPLACMAAKASLCAAKQTDFWKIHDEIFHMQRKLNKNSLLKLAADNKLNEADFTACIDSDETKERVLKDIETGKKFYIEAVPTIIANGRNLRYWRDSRLLQAVVKEEIKKQEARDKEAKRQRKDKSS